MSHVGEGPETPAQFIAGEPRAGTGGDMFPVVDPATGRTVWTYETAGPADVDAAVAAAKAALPEWAAAAPGERAAALHRLARLVEERAADLARAESLQCGKPIRLSSGFDVPGTVDNTDFFAGAARHLEGRAAGEYSPDHTSYVRREPVGVVGSVAPWNYPLQMAAWKILPAVAAGNTIVLKPSELTPLTTLMFAEAARDAGLPARRGQRGHRHRPGGRRAPGRAPGRGDDLLHRLHRRRPADRRPRRGHRQARPSGTGRQGPVRGLRRRRPGGRRARRGGRLAHQLRPGLHGGDPRLRPAAAVRRLRGRRRRPDGAGCGSATRSTRTPTWARSCRTPSATGSRPWWSGPAATPRSSPAARRPATSSPRARTTGRP